MPTPIAAGLPRRAWNCYSAGPGAKGARDYDWAFITIIPPEGETGGRHHLMIRRRITDGELAFYRCWTPKPTGLAALTRVAGIRWHIETCFQTAKNATGLDEHQLRRWDSWYRHTTLVLLAHAILATAEARRPRPAGLIPLSLPEIRRLFTRLTATTHTIGHHLAWSLWRRRHQANARTSHYHRRGHPEHQPAAI